MRDDVNKEYKMMNKKLSTPSQTLSHAKDLRLHATNAEKVFWSKIRNRQFLNLKFRRQHPIPPYIVDFYCEERLLIIECDGGQHNEEVDKIRTDFLIKKGYTIFRYWNNDIIQNIEGVMENLMNKMDINIHRQNPHPNPLPEGEGV